MKAVIAQLNLLVGDLKGNAAKILDAAKSAAAVNADLLLTPELSICSYQPEDLLLRPSFISACKTEVEALATQLPPTLAASYESKSYDAVSGVTTVTNLKFANANNPGDSVVFADAAATSAAP